MFPTHYMHTPVEPDPPFVEGDYLVNPTGALGTTGWTTTAGTLEPRTSSNPSGSGYFFQGGNNATSQAYQRIDVTDFPLTIPTASIDAGTLNIRGTWWGGTYIQSPDDDPRIQYRFLDALEVEISTSTNGYREPVTVYYTSSRWEQYVDEFSIPPNTRYIDIIMDFDRNAGTHNDASIAAIELEFYED